MTLDETSNTTSRGALERGEVASIPGASAGLVASETALGAVERREAALATASSATQRRESALATAPSATQRREAASEIAKGNAERREQGLARTRRYRLLLILLVLIMLVCATISTCLGRYPVSVLEFLHIIQGVLIDASISVRATLLALFTGADAQATAAAMGQGSILDSMDSSAVTAVLKVRLPRIIVCLFVGAALSVAGAAYQGVFQNPMASQDVLGASSGAAFGAALAILLSFNAFGITVLSFTFGVAAVVISYSVSKMGRDNPVLALILSGMVVSSLCSSGTSAVKLVADTEDALPSITYWLMGSLAAIRTSDVLPTVGMLCLAMLPVFLLRWRISLLATGEDEARSLGINTGLMRLIIIGLATLITATCVSMCGLIGWVGLVVPHFCRMIFGQDYRRVIPASMLLGASFLLVVDDIARLCSTSEIPIGILTSFVGAPIFIFLIARGGTNGKSRR